MSLQIRLSAINKILSNEEEKNSNLQREFSLIPLTIEISF